MATIMQKAVLPNEVDVYLRSGADQVAGFVLRAADVAEARTPAQIFEAHGLGFPESPFSPDMLSVHVVRFPATPQLRFEDAIGGTDNATAARTGGPFVDRPPFTGIGFSSWSGGTAPLYWLVRSRLPAGSELLRFSVDGSSTLVARYVDVATGWVGGEGQPPLVPAQVPAVPAPYIGLMARFEGNLYSADLLVDAGRVVLSSPANPAGSTALVQTPIGRWRREVALADLSELFELSMTGWINGLHMRVIDNAQHDGKPALWVTYIGHNADIAEGLGLRKMDAGVYDAMIPADALTDVQTIQMAADTWPGAR